MIVTAKVTFEFLLANVSQIIIIKFYNFRVFGYDITVPTMSHLRTRAVFPSGLSFAAENTRKIVLEYLKKRCILHQLVSNGTMLQLEIIQLWL